LILSKSNQIYLNLIKFT